MHHVERRSALVKTADVVLPNTLVKKIMKVRQIKIVKKLVKIVKKLVKIVKKLVKIMKTIKVKKKI